MNKKILGIVIIAVGAALFIWGYNIYDSASAQVTRAINGDTPIEAWLGMVGGAITVLIGLSKVK
ncbi:MULTISPECIES: DUF3185 family protein [Shewanella]|jgi:hypothetical protein|uniref:DUF3185 family protein n=1 Tax=Shewanella TaxID=22 RepID=UPI001CF8D855|nr:DUF3185 family protein [Shewanella glacialimarina]UCX04345.1 DUF3185 family protein [Shewanella glacialimarina]